MAVDYNNLGELIDGYGGIAADDLVALPAVRETIDDEIALLRAENNALRESMARMQQALAETELVLVSLRGAVPCSVAVTA